MKYISIFLAFTSIVLSSGFSTDVLILTSRPSLNDPTVRVSTYYRDLPDPYYFTVIYEFVNNMFFKFRTYLNFDYANAAKTHFKCVYSARAKIFSGEAFDLENRDVCPIDYRSLPR